PKASAIFRPATAAYAAGRLAAIALASQETGAIRSINPFACKGGCAVFSNFSFSLSFSFVPRIFLVLVSTASCAWSAEIKVSVVDPDARPVAGAQVRILSGSSVVASQNTAGSGEASFNGISAQELG